MNATNLFRLAAAGAMIVAAVGAQAQTWPSRPITINFGTAVGGPMDLLSRVVSAQWEKKFGQRVIVESRPGVGGSVAFAYLVKQAPDGHNFVMSGSPLTTSLFVKNLQFDPFKDVAPVSIAALQQYYLLVSRAMNIRTLKDFVAYAKANPGKTSIGIVAAGPHEIETNLMLESLGISVNLIGYRGLASVYPALMSGELNATLGATPPALKSGEIVGIALGGSQRNPDYPDIPTFLEGGSQYNPQANFGFFAHGQTPRDVLNRASAELAAAVKSEEFKTRVTRVLNIEGLGSTPEFAEKYLRDEYARQKRIADRLGIKPQ